MSIQRRFAVLLAIFGLSIAGSLAAALWAFSTIEREVVAPFQGMTGVLRTLRNIKRDAEDQATLLLGEAQWQERGANDDGQGVRGVRLGGQVGAEAVARLRRMQDHTAQELMALRQWPMWEVRAGQYAAESLEERIERASVLGLDWLDAGVETSRSDAGAALFEIHELIEAIEGRILDDARMAVAFRERLRQSLFLFLGVVAALAALVGLLSMKLVRRWIVSPVADLRVAAERIGAGDFAHRVEIEGRDELALLGHEVNEMAGLVQRMQDERIERERLAVAGEMMRRLAHNIRNPLAGIRGLAEMSIDDLGDKPELQDHQRRIVDSVDRFEQWLNRLLRATSPADIHLKKGAVGEWLSGIVAAHEPMARARGIRIVVERVPVGDMLFDPDHLAQAVAAILSNAIEATTDNGTVRIRSQVGDAGWTIAIEDEGPGIPDDILPNIFRPSFTTKKQGTGIGLASALHAVRGHGGRIEVRNLAPANGNGKRPRGAEFEIVLPGSEPGTEEASIGQ